MYFFKFDFRNQFKWNYPQFFIYLIFLWARFLYLMFYFRRVCVAWAGESHFRRWARSPRVDQAWRGVGRVAGALCWYCRTAGAGTVGGRPHAPRRSGVNVLSLCRQVRGIRHLIRQETRPLQARYAHLLHDRLPRARAVSNNTKHISSKYTTWPLHWITWRLLV